MGRYYIRLFMNEQETDWTSFDEDALDYLLTAVIDFCCPVYHSSAYYDTIVYDGEISLIYMMHGKPAPFPETLLHKTIEFGWGKDRKELRLFGDRIPIDDHVKFQITYY